MGAVTSGSVGPPRSKIEGLWSGCKSACQHDFMTGEPSLCGPDHTGDDRSVGCCWAVRAQRCHLGVDARSAFCQESQYSRGDREIEHCRFFTDTYYQHIYFFQYKAKFYW